MAANIKADLINVSEIVTNTLIVTSDSVMVNGQNLRDYIANVLKITELNPRLFLLLLIPINFRQI